jgi:hypothetical protein
MYDWYIGEQVRLREADLLRESLESQKAYRLRRSRWQLPKLSSYISGFIHNLLTLMGIWDYLKNQIEKERRIL